MTPRGRTWRGLFTWALEAWDVTLCPSIIRYRQSTSAPIRVEFSDMKRDDALDILRLLNAHDSTGYLYQFAIGLRWEQIPECYQGRVKVDIREYVAELRRNALLPCPECGGELEREGTKRAGRVRCRLADCGWAGHVWGGYERNSSDGLLFG